MLKLVAFDMDGTLVDVSSSWGAVHQHFGLSNAKALEQFIHDEIDDEEFIRADVRLWKTRAPELTIDEVEAILDRVPLMSGASELVGGLRARGLHTAIVSGGIDLLARRIGRELGMDYVLANGIRCTTEGRLIEDGILRVPIKRKGEALRAVQRHLGVTTEETAAVGNSDIDIAMFHQSRLGIAFRPEDEATRRAATAVVEGHSLAPALEILLQAMGE
jgi:phosphoserine phosphatase